ncbi:diguanylate cyclase (GGDEF) domain-containing protein [Peptoclostridium litorale DSM 5388]|uniref:Putative signaling protein n=1 Tax=Peptoclostridium litorale DSM 5388 TaxID=1121324 RepID=A0A069RHR2_PEPLI|nr:bifunctional diguanylate cyclase/phosphodiesterase [Peptoclostridium litorale]KDR96559.1 putative signaling protein [Peptoclostridium litorale DSM 5388]SIN69141.1 diguanylate cyclase (GGDEF) domain-containing protein [Peptoclostridium litorale DSM 5388]
MEKQNNIDFQNIHNIKYSYNDSSIRHDLLFEHLPEAVFILDKYKIINCNSFAIDLFNCHSKKDLVDLDFSILSIDKTKKSTRSIDRNNSMIDGAIKVGACHFVSSYFKKDGSSFLASISFVHIPEDSYGRIVAVVRDITENNKKEQEINTLAFKDGLTGLYNRNYFLKHIDQKISESPDETFAILFMDLDGFKKINDNLGHANGDKLLEVVGNKLKTVMGPSNKIARIGGDEFITLINSAYDTDEIIEFANRVVEFFQQPFIFDTHIFHMSISIGIAIYPLNGCDVETLIKNADIAMYKAKENTGSHIEFFSQNLNEKINSQFVLENNLWFALDNDEFYLEYQPIIDIESTKIVSAETLTRWQSKKLGLIPPYKFIPIAEENNLIIPIGKWVLKEACRQNKEWQDMGIAPITIAVNVSLKQLEQDDFVDTVNEILEETGLDPKYLEIELTESIPVENISHIINVLSSLSGLGIKLSIDDFGTGYSSLGQLKKLSIDKLKIDKSFVNDINVDTDNTQIVSTIIAMANILKLQVVAEGIETNNQLSFLKENHCDMGQGFLFSRPLGKDSFIEFLKNNSK